MAARLRVMIVCGQSVRLPLETPSRFELDDVSGPEKLAQYLRAHHPNRPVRILAVDGGEQFHTEPLSSTACGRKHKTLAAERAAQLLTDAGHTLAVPCTRSKEILYAGLTTAHGMQALLMFIKHCRIPLEGIYSPAWVWAYAARDLCNASCLVVSVHDAGLRQVLLVAAVPRYSRLAPVPSQADARWYAEACLETVQRLRTKFQSIPVPLQVILYLPPNTGAAVAARLNETVPGCVCIAPGCTDCDHRLAQLLCVYQDCPNYAYSAETAAYRRLLLARAFCATGLGCGLLGASVGAWLHMDSRALQAQAARLQDRVQQAHAQLHETNISSAVHAQIMRHAVDTAARLEPGPTAPLLLLRALGAALLHEPDLILERLQWHNDTQQPYLQLQLSVSAMSSSDALWSIDRLATSIRDTGAEVRVLDTPLHNPSSADPKAGQIYFRLRISNSDATQITH